MNFFTIVVLLLSVLFSGCGYLLHVEQVGSVPTRGGNDRAALEKIQHSEGSCRIRLNDQHPWVYVGTSGVQRMSERMLGIVLQLDKQLDHDKAFVRHIGAMIEMDISDTKQTVVVPTEIGGIGIYVDGSFELLPIPFLGRYRLQSYRDSRGVLVRSWTDLNGAFLIPKWVMEKIPHAFTFHLHAFENEYDHCSPSFRASNAIATGDIENAIRAIQWLGFTHRFVFSNVGERAFSIVYYGGELLKNGEWFVSVVSLKNREY